jgi:hypothetical protein
VKKLVCRELSQKNHYSFLPVSIDTKFTSITTHNQIVG